MARHIKISVIQLGPCSPNKRENIDRICQLIDEAAQEKPDFIALPETATTQFFAVGLKRRSYFDLAEPILGPTTEAIGQKAKQYGCYIVLPMYEKGRLEGQYYNSSALIGPDGKIIEGVLPDGEKMPAYRKNYISDYNWDAFQNDEKFYFAVGQGYPIFQTEHGTVGMQICYDRWFPEGYKILALRGCELVFVPVASCGFVGELFVAGLRTHAAENAFVVVGINKAGIEVVEGVETPYYGLSCIVGPGGKVVAQAPEMEEAIIHGEVDLDEIREVRRKFFVYRDRRPDLYTPIVQRV